MKTSVGIYSLAFIMLLSTNAFAQQTVKQQKEAAAQTALKSKIEGQNYTFNATYALPQRGGQKYLTSSYDLRVTKDSVIAFLPYFGQVYMSAPITPEENAIMFTSTKFTYKMTPKKKGVWSITITPAGVKYVSKLQLDVYNNGSAYLVVTSNYRDQISFQGDMKTAGDLASN